MSDNKNTQTRVATVLQRMSEMISKDARYADIFTGELNTMLEQIKQQNGFGEHAEYDPRGDGRDGTFSLDYVSGIDDDCPHGTPTTHDCELRIQHGVCAGCGRQTIYPK